MNIENELEKLKIDREDVVILVKIGVFYHAYGKDAYVLSYLCNYQIKKAQKMSSTGFPVSTIDSVLKKLESEKISYVVMNKSDNYSIENEQVYLKEENCYFDIYNKANKYIRLKDRIDEISRYLLENINSKNIKEKLNEIEDILYD